MVLLIALLASSPAGAATIHAGSLTTFSSVDELDTDGEFAYVYSLGDDGSTGGYDAGTDSDGERVIGGLDFAAYVTGSAHGDVSRADFGDADMNAMIGTVIFGGSIGIDLPVTPGIPYRLQLISWESYWEQDGLRVFDVNVEGGSVEVENLDAYAESSAAGDPDQNAVLYTLDFTAGGDTLNIHAPASTNNTILSGMTLEVLPEPGAVALLVLGGLAILGRRNRKAQ
jgi:hypothetical protein